MNAEVAVAGLSCLALALGHTAIGMRSVLPHLKRARSNSAAGLSATEVGMLRFTWHVVTVMLVAFAGVLLSLALVPDANAKTVLLRWFGAFWLAATVLAIWTSRRRLGYLVRQPIPLLFILAGVMCLKASA